MFESNLVPVVGFHSNGESVRVNFGVAPFAYQVRRRRDGQVEEGETRCTLIDYDSRR